MADENIHAKEIDTGGNRTMLIGHSIKIDEKRTSIKLEKEMWIALKEVARSEKCTVHDLCTVISHHKKGNRSLSSAIRIFIMAYYKAAATSDGHKQAGHGIGSSVAVGLVTEHHTTPYYGLREFKTLHDR